MYNVPMIKAEILELVKGLVSIESTADKPENLYKAVDFIGSILNGFPQIKVERFENNGKPSLLAYCGPKRPARFKVLMNGHVDVVPGNLQDFVPFVKDGKLYGRGSGDMKTAALMMTLVFCELAPKINYTLGLQIVADEEIGGFNGTKYQIDQGVKSDFVIIGEGSAACTLCPEARGICWADVRFSGRPAHGAYPWRGDNAALKAVEFVHEITKIYPVPKTEKWATTVNVAALSTANSANNRVPDDAKVSLDVRYLSGDSNFTSRQTAQGFLENLSPGAHVDITMFEPAYAIDRQNPTLQKLITAIEQDAGQQIEFVRRYGSSDARFYGASGTSAVTFGLPDHNIHADGEFIEVEWISRYRKVLEQFLLAV